MDYSGTPHSDLLKMSITIVQIRVQSLQLERQWERIKENPIAWAESLTRDKRHMRSRTSAQAQAHMGTHSWAHAQDLQYNGIYSPTSLEMSANISQRTLNQRRILKWTMWGKKPNIDSSESLQSGHPGKSSIVGWGWKTLP